MCIRCVCVCVCVCVCAGGGGGRACACDVCVFVCNKTVGGWLWNVSVFVVIIYSTCPFGFFFSYAECLWFCCCSW